MSTENTNKKNLLTCNMLIEILGLKDLVETSHVSEVVVKLIPGGVPEVKITSYSTVDRKDVKQIFELKIKDGR